MPDSENKLQSCSRTRREKNMTVDGKLDNSKAPEQSLRQDNFLRDVYDELNSKGSQLKPAVLNELPERQLDFTPVFPSKELADPRLRLASAELKQDTARNGQNGKKEPPVEKSQEEKEQAAFNAGLYGEFKGKDSIKAISVDACVQATDIGNCYMVAAIAAKANIDPEGIMKMISENKDGTFTVDFPGLDKPITVSKPCPEEIKRFPNFEEIVSRWGTWPIVLQKALGEYYKEKGGLDGCQGGSIFSAGMKALNKEQVKYEGIGALLPFMSEKEVHERLMQKLNPENKSDRKPMTASASAWKRHKDICANHVYTVLKYEQHENISKSMVTVRNPWGGPDAELRLTLDEFRRDFLQLSYPEKNATAIPSVAQIRPFLKGVEINYEEQLKKLISK